MSSNKSKNIETLCVHAGIEPEPITGAVMTPIFQTSTYAQTAPGEHKGYDYSRAGNPTRTALEASMAALEHANHAVSFSSGLAAVQAVIQCLTPKAHVIVSEDVYGGTGRLFRKLFVKYGLEFEFLDLTDLAAVEKALRPETEMIWVETPTNPTLQVIDTPAIAKLAKKVDAAVLVDNTFCSPVFQQPLNLGADIVLHSTTKYIGGHSDIVGGAVMTNDEKWAEEIRFVQFAAGPVNSPLECFLLLRSIKTLAIRMERHSENAMKIAKTLEDEKLFKRVIFPGLPSHPQYELAKTQMTGYPGMVTVFLEGGLERVTRFLTSLELFTLAESLGGVESLVNHPETMTHASVPPELRERLGIDASMIRFSVGIENCDDLLEDIRQALKK